MSVMFYGGKILIRGGQIALDPRCCCPGRCCGCDWLTAYYEDWVINLNNRRLRATFSGGASGYVILDPISSNIGACTHWRGDDFSNALNSCSLWNLSPAIEFFCRSVGQTSISAYELEILDSTVDDCRLTTPIFQSGNCGPPLTATYKSLTYNAFDVCACGEGTEVFITITLEDTWP